MIKNYTKAVLLFSILITILIIGCKRESVLDNPIDPILPPPTTVTLVNDLTQVTASVSGIVFDESNAPIASAVVTSGGATTTTNSNGMFIFQNISLSKENGSVTVVKAGYFKGVRSFKTTAGKNHTVRLQLMQKFLSGTVNAAAGGTINSNGGASIIFPAAAFVTSTGAIYTGTVNVYSRWINPTAANLSFIIPGDLRGVGISGAENILETYGMVGAELEDANGNTLKIATGKKATISFPLPASLQASAPATIQLWHFDDATARWKENGTATKTGNTYAALVDKFSFWNCDVANSNFINLDYTLINATTNSPLVSTSTRIKRANGSYGFGITNNAGFVSGLVPKNELLILEVFSDCNTVIYSQNIGPFVNSTSLGNVSPSLSTSQYITFTGTLLNCNASPVTNGYVSLYTSGGGGGYASTNVYGIFSFTILNCSINNVSYSCQGTDNTTSVQSSVLTGNTNNGVVNLGNISTCTAAAVDIYVAGYQTSNSTFVATVWKNGVASNLTVGVNNGFSDASANSIFVLGSDVYVAGRERNLSTGGIYVAKVWKNGVVTNLTNGISDANANSIFVSGTDVYVAGFEINTTNGKAVAKIWKNGIATSLNSGFLDSYANSVFVSGTDVYVTGSEINVTNGINVAKIWKNGIVTILTNSPLGSLDAIGKSIFVSNSDVYVTGYESNSSSGGATVWKNGIVSNLTPGLNFSVGNSIFVSGADVYVSGQIGNDGYIWKNGIASSLPIVSGTYGRGNSVFVYGTDVYIAGYVFNGTEIATIWKNGQALSLTNNSGLGAKANSIFVK